MILRKTYQRCSPCFVVAYVFVFLLNKYNKIPDNVSVKAGFSMLFFIVLLIVLVNGNFNVID